MPERINGGHALVVLGAVTLFVSLFLHWYEPGRSAWTVFEAWDLVLAAIAIGAIATVVPLRPSGADQHLVAERWLPALAGAALVIVVLALVNHPPAARGSGPEVGAWLALGSAIVLVAGTILSRARISVVITLQSNGSDRSAAPTPPPEPTGDDLEAETATQPLPPQGGG